MKIIKSALAPEEVASILYHDIFSYPLNSNDLIKWKAGFVFNKNTPKIKELDGFYFVQGKNGLIYQRLKNERMSLKKIRLLRRSLFIFRLIKTIRLVSIIGSLAMKNAKSGDDLDLLIVTKPHTLWLTRAITYLLLFIFRIGVRKSGDKVEKGKLCLNMWMEESSLGWPKNDQNCYTAHEFAQMVPLFNKHHLFERLIDKNKWIKDFWPNAMRFTRFKQIKVRHTPRLFKIINLLSYYLQYWYMKPKITKEEVRLNRALFHPHIWGKEVQDRLSQYGFKLKVKNQKIG